MKRSLLPLVVVVLSCQQQTASPSATLVGLRDMVRIGEFMFATSTERDELRVLDLVTGDTASPRKYVRAPNPIQPLSIPVLRRPTALATDTYYLDRPEGTGLEVGGPYVYASSPGVSQLSIVWGEGADPISGYTELARLNTVAPVTAMSARGSMPTILDDGAVVPAPETLYFATFDGTNATLFRLPMVAPGQLDPSTLQAGVRTVLTRTGQTIIDLVALPNGRVAIATRNVRSPGGSAEVIDGTTGQVVVPLQFPSAVRAIYSHAQFTLTSPDRMILGGARVYGLLDEEACGSASCAGLVAVDADTGLRTLSQPGFALGDGVPREQRIAPPLTFGNGIIQSVSLTAGGAITLPLAVTGPPGSTDPQPLPLLGIVSLTNGQIGFFAAGELVQLNTVETGPSAGISTPDGGSVTITSIPTATGIELVGGSDAGFNFPTVTLAEGAARDETVFAVGNGVVLNQVPAVGVTVLTTTPDRIRLDDTVDGCAAVVSKLIPGGFELSAPCGELVTVRAGPMDPYVVAGTVSGYMGRSGPGQTLFFPGTYSQHFIGYNPTLPAFAIAFPAEAIGRDERYEIALDDGYLPLVLQITQTACAAGFTTLPGTVVNDPIRQTIFAAYPSANAIVEIPASRVRRTFTLESGLLCWR